MKYKICPICGSHLDFGESCDCGKGTTVGTAETEDKEGGEDYGENVTGTDGGRSGSIHHSAGVG